MGGTNNYFLIENDPISDEDCLQGFISFGKSCPLGQEGNAVKSLNHQPVFCRKSVIFGPFLEGAPIARLFWCHPLTGGVGFG